MPAGCSTSSIFLLLTLFSFTACQNHPKANNDIKPTKATQVIVEYLTAELQGNLVLDNQCLRVKSQDGVSYLLVWPPDFSVAHEGNTVHVTQGAISGDRKEYDLKIGEDIDIGGGDITGGTDDLVETFSFRVSPKSCSGPYWAFGGIAKK